MRLCARAFLGLVLSTACIAEDKPVDDPPSPMVKAEGEVVIDGALDEAFWKKAEVIRGDYVNSKKGVLSDEPHLSVKYAWDEHYLYIGYETFDKNLIAKASGIKDGPEKNKRDGCEIWSPDPKEKVDVVEFFISFGDEHFFWEIHHNALNQFNDVWCTSVDPSWPIAKSSMSNWGILFNYHESIADDGDFTTAMAVKLKPKADGTTSTVNKSDDEDTGYTAEIRLPWGGIGAPASAKPDAKKKETDWKMDGQKIQVLAVVQDGDLKERYHHSAPKRSGDWFHKTVPLWPKYVLSKTAEKKGAALDLKERTPEELAAEFLKKLDKHEATSELLQALTESGMAGARACVAGLIGDAQHDESIYDLIAVASRCRRSNREMLRLYDAAAFAMFYTDAGEGDQKKIASALSAKDWSRFVPEALVNGAPRPLLEWLNAQAASGSPDVPKLLAIWKEWGAAIFFHRERQYTAEVRRAVAALTKNAKLSSDAATLAALLRFAGECGASELAEFAGSALSSSDANVRAEACQALQRFGGELAPTALVKIAETETDAAVLLRIAEALGAWPHDGTAGKAAIGIFQRCENAEVRRALLFAAGGAAWAERPELILKSFEKPDGGVLGAGLQALAEKREPEIAARALDLMSVYKSPPAPLIDALGGVGDAKAAGYLIATLRETKNLSIRIKIILALEKIGGDEAQRALLEQLKDTSNALYAQQLAGVAGRMKLPGAEEILISLAEDLTAPLPVRVQCLWSLGAFKSDAVRAALKRMDEKPEHYFGSAEISDADASVYEKVEQARMLIKMALLQQGESGAGEAAAELYARGTPTTKLSMLMLLKALKLDHAVIADGLKSPDFAVMLAAVHAAGAAAPKKYHAQLVALENAPFVKAMIDTSLDLNDFDDVLEHAIAAGN
jgi:HEAT repeat protein